MYYVTVCVLCDCVCIVLLFSIRKKQNMLESFSGMVFGQKMDLYTPAELHSEIFYAECNMLLSLLTFFQVGVANDIVGVASNNYVCD